jgi:hypothetical protein
MFAEDVGYLSDKSSCASSVNTAIDAGLFRGRCVILALSKASLDLKRNLRELGLLTAFQVASLVWG